MPQTRPSVGYNLQPKNHRKHAKRRARKRYGIELTRDELEQLAEIIREGGAEYLWRTYDRTVWKVQHNGKELIAVYELERDLIITFLPLTAVEDRRKRGNRKRGSIRRP